MCVKSSLTFAMLSQSTRSAYHPSWSSPSYTAPTCSTFPRNTERYPSFMFAALAYPEIVHSRTVIYPVCDEPAPLRVRRRKNVARFRLLKVLPAIARSIFQHSHPYPTPIALIASPREPIYIEGSLSAYGKLRDPEVCKSAVFFNDELSG